jgi:hypothetical protein
MSGNGSRPHTDERWSDGSAAVDPWGPPPDPADDDDLDRPTSAGQWAPPTSFRSGPSEPWSAGDESADVWPAPRLPHRDGGTSGDEWAASHPSSSSGDAWDPPHSGSGDQWAAPDPSSRSGDRWAASHPSSRSGDAWGPPHSGSGDEWAAPDPSSHSGDEWAAPDPSSRAADQWAAPHSSSADEWAAPDPSSRAGDQWAAPHSSSGDEWAAPDPSSRSGDEWAAPDPSSHSGDEWGPSQPISGDHWPAPDAADLTVGAGPPLSSLQPGPAGPPPIGPPLPSEPPRQVFVPAPEELGDPAVDDRLPPFLPDPEPAAALPMAHGPAPAPRPPAARPHRIDRRRLAVVYDIEGPRVRLGVAWFVGAMLATLISPFTAAAVYAVAAGLAGRQIARAWGITNWQADMAAGLAGVPVMAALGGTPMLVGTLVVAAVAAVGSSLAPDGARMRGPGGRLAAAGILCLTAVPAIGCGAFVLVRQDSVIAAVVLLAVASAYEAADYIVGSGASNPLEGPLAGITTATLIALPLAQLLVEPFDTAGVALLAFAALAYPFGQIVASAVLPGAGAPASALRRIDTLLLLAPLWAVAAGAI